MSLFNFETWLKIIQKLDNHLIENQQPPLNPIERSILQGMLEEKTYSQIAKETGYSSTYITNVVAPKLWRRMSEVMGQKITKKNCQYLLQSYFTVSTTTTRLPNYSNSFSYPSGAIPLNCEFYIKRGSIEEKICAEIKSNGALIRIKAPQEMGKTSLLLRVLEFSNQLGYHIVNLNLQQADQEILSDLKRFLRWLCANISHQLNLEKQLDEYWDEDMGSGVSCTLYLHHILEQLEKPLLLALDEVNQIFEYPQVAKSFLPLLRSWHEETKETPLWENLRLVVIHSTEVYVPLQLNQSPFSNVGFPIDLPNFNSEQVQELAKRYGLAWEKDKEVKQLMSVMNGHPALIHLTLYHLSQQEITLEKLLEDAPTLSGIYASHLRRHQGRLEEQPRLAEACHYIMNADEPVSVEPILAYKLYSMGLIDLKGDRAFPRVSLYKDYFKHKLNPNHNHQN